MKITIELETDEDKAQALRFLGSDATPIVATLERGAGLRALLAVRQVTPRPENAERTKIREERLARRRK